MFRQQRGMNVDDAALKCPERRRAELSHVSAQQHKVDLMFPQLAADRLVAAVFIGISFSYGPETRSGPPALYSLGSRQWLEDAESPGSVSVRSDCRRWVDEPAATPDVRLPSGGKPGSS